MYDSREDTLRHIERVRVLLKRIQDELAARGRVHDRSKLNGDEKRFCDECSPLLKGMTYDSQEYRDVLQRMRPAIEHHYAHNSHHPEHYPNGIEGMTLVDLVEMFCDFKAASKRHTNGNFSESILIAKERHGLSDQLATIMENTRQELGW